jgi:hypothetical protein
MKLFLPFLFLLFISCAGNGRSFQGNKLVSEMAGEKGLLALWDFHDSSGKAVAGSEKHLQLKAIGGNRRIAEGPLSGYSLQLDGVSDYWSISNAESKALDVKNVTVIAWVKWSGGTGFVAGKWNESADGGRRQYGLFVSLPYYNGANQVCGHISRNGGATPPYPFSIDYSASRQEVQKNEWTCIAFTYDGKYIRSYVNGIFQVREAELIERTAGFLHAFPKGITQVKNPYYYPDGIGNNGSDFTVGAVELKKGMGNFFKGAIGGIAVFDRALNDKHVLRICRANK